MAEGIPLQELQAVSYHLFTKCAEKRAAFDECFQSAGKGGCTSEYTALMSCTKDL